MHRATPRRRLLNMNLYKENAENSYSWKICGKLMLFVTAYFQFVFTIVPFRLCL